MTTTLPRRHTVLADTLIGPVTTVGEGDAIVGVYMATIAHPPESIGEPGDDPLLRRAAHQLDEYFAGTLQTFDLPLRPQGTEFQQAVWKALQDIPYGETASYGELARKIGQPTASRAVGLANGRNPISIVIPCHRVVGANGSLVGYGGGVERKRTLLDLEQERLF